jgi:hypothetical protein
MNETTTDTAEPIDPEWQATCERWAAELNAAEAEPTGNPGDRPIDVSRYAQWLGSFREIARGPPSGNNPKCQNTFPPVRQTRVTHDPRR